MSSRTQRIMLSAGLLAAPFLFVACFTGHTPDPALEVEANIASVTLADDCGGSGLRAEPPADCAPDVPDCGGFCQQTGVRLTLEAAAEGESVPFEVLEVRLHRMDAESIRLVQTLSPSAIQLFDGSTYVAWDRVIHPGDSLHVSVDTNAPDWSAIGGGEPWSTYGMSFMIEMRVQIDGVERSLFFSPASREPEVVT